MNRQTRIGLNLLWAAAMVVALVLCIVTEPRFGYAVGMSLAFVAYLLECWKTPNPEDEEN